MTTFVQETSSLIGFEYMLTPVPKGTGGSSVNGADFLSVQTISYTGAITWNDFNISIQSIGVSVVNTSPYAVSIDNYPLLERVSGNYAEVFLEDHRGVRELISFGFSFSSSGNYTTSRGWVPGSVPDFCWNLIEPRLDGDLNLFSDVNHTTASYPLNENCWASGWDFSGISVWSSTSANFVQCAVAISDRVVRMTWHFRLPVGAKVRFRGSDGNIYTYTIVATNPGANFSPSVPFHENHTVGDICIGILDRDLDPSIKRYPIVGNWFYVNTNLPTENRLNPVSYGLAYWSPFDSFLHYSGATIRVNQSRQVLVETTAAISSNSLSLGATRSYGSETLPIWSQFYAYQTGFPPFLDNYSEFQVPVIVGDSSTPRFCPLNGTDLALVGLFSTTTGSYQENADIINAIIRVTETASGITTGNTVTVAPSPLA